MRSWMRTDYIDLDLMHVGHITEFVYLGVLLDTNFNLSF